eukprot:gene36070-5803_t
MPRMVSEKGGPGAERAGRKRWSSYDGTREMQRADFPVPGVGRHRPCDCEWAGEWETVVTALTDDEGWRYAGSFCLFLNEQSS